MKKLIIILVFICAIALIANQVQDPNVSDNPNSSSEKMFVGSSTSDVEIAERGTPFEAKLLSIKAFNYVNEVGKEKAFKDFLDDKSEFIQKDLYIFVIDMNGNVLVHAEDNELMNKNLIELKDSKGEYFIKNFITIMGDFDSGWSEYYWRNYTTQEIETKLTYLMKIDENTFLGCGAYQK